MSGLDVLRARFGLALRLALHLGVLLVPLAHTSHIGSGRAASSHGYGHDGGHDAAPAGGHGSGVHAPAPGNPTTGALAANEPDTVRLSNGMHVPMIGLGTFAIQDPATIKAALELGYRHLDCAWFYKNERVVGEGIQDFLAAGRRQELFITSKVWNTHHRPEAVRRSVEESLASLGCGHLDLLLMHWPLAWTPDSGFVNPVMDTEVTILDTWRAMEALVDEGKVKALGVSNFGLKQTEELLSACRIKPVVNQIELHPQLAQRKLVGVSFRLGVQCLAYSPLGGQGSQQNNLLHDALVAQVAKEVGKSPAQVLIKWNIQRGVPVLAKSSQAERLRENLEGMYSWKLSNEHKAMLDSMDSGKHYIDASWAPWHLWPDPQEGGVTKPRLAMKAAA